MRIFRTVSVGKSGAKVVEVQRGGVVGPFPVEEKGPFFETAV